MANAITCIRIICSMALLFCPTLTISFYVLYLIAGFTDMVDGMVARKTNSVSELGSIFDTVADFVLVAVCFVKLMPVIDIVVWMYIWIVVISFIKAVNIVSGYVIQKKPVVVHSATNKVTGILLFVLPFTLPFIDLKYSALVVCVIATFAAIQEGVYIRTGKNKIMNTPSFLCLKNNRKKKAYPAEK